MIAVAAALGVEVGQAAGGSAQFRRQAGKADVELIHSFNRRRNDVE